MVLSNGNFKYAKDDRRKKWPRGPRHVEKIETNPLGTKHETSFLQLLATILRLYFSCLTIYYSFIFAQKAQKRYI